MEGWLVFQTHDDASLFLPVGVPVTIDIASVFFNVDCLSDCFYQRLVDVSV